MPEYNGATVRDYSVDNPLTSRKAMDAAYAGQYPGATAVADRWIAPAAGNVTTFSTQVNRLYTDDFYIPKECSISELACQVTAAGTAGAVIRLGLYSDIDGIPGTLIAETGTLDATTIGVKSATITSGRIVPGRYWLGAVSQVATCSVYANNQNADQHWSTSALAAIQFIDTGFAADGVNANLPSTFVSVGSIDSVVRVSAKIAI